MLWEYRANLDPERVVWRTQSQTLAGGSYFITMAPLYYSAPPVTFEHRGEQMVAVYASGNCRK